jgi:hypothetical protein
LYYASIATALLSSRKLITALAPSEIQKGMRWAGDQTWLSDPLRHLFVDAQRLLDEPAVGKISPAKDMPAIDLPD